MRRTDSIAVVAESSSTSLDRARNAGSATVFQDQYRTQADNVSSFSHYLWVIRRNRWKLLAFVLVSTVATVIVSKRLTPLYESTATIEMDRQTQADVVGSEHASAINGEDMQNYLATQERLIESDAVLRPVVQKYHLDQDVMKNLSKDKALSSRFQETPITLKSLRVTQPPHTFLLLISYRSPDPNLAAGVVNEIAQSYIRHSYEIRAESAAELTTYMEKQLTELRAKMERSAGALANFEKDLDVIDPEDKSNVLAARLLQLNNDLTAAEADRAAKQAAYNAAKDGSLEAAEASEHGQQLRDLQVKLQEAEQRFADVQTQFGPEFPAYKKAAGEVKELQRQIAAMTKSVVQQVALSYQQAVDRQSLLQKSMLQAKADFDQMNSRSFEYKALAQEATTDKSLYEELIKKISEAGINASFQSSPARLADTGRPALYPSFPNTRLNALIALLGSALIGISILLLHDSLTATVFDPEILHRELGVAQLPPLPEAVLPNQKMPPVTLQAPTSSDGSNKSLGFGYSRSGANAYYEAIRTLRSAILLSGDLNHPPRSILVTSASPSEGKSTIALNLAVADSLQNRKTLLIDGDLRRPSINLNLRRDIGLSDVITGRLDWKQAIQTQHEYPNLDVLMAGGSSRLVADRVGGTMRRVLEEAEREYDLVIVDSPPLIGFAEPVEFAAMADAVVLIVRAGETSRTQVAAAVGQLRSIKASLLGFVLNGIRADMSSNYYYYSRKYYGAYDAE